MKKLLLLLASVAAIFTACEGGLDNDENGVPAESNKILYTSSDGSIIIPNKSDVFGANIISNLYDAEKECWVINFDAPVTSIGEDAFFFCTSLTSITIPDSVTSIAEGAFSYCDSLKAFYGKFASADNRCLIVDGVLNSFAIGCGATEYTIPDSVTEIGIEAFDGCKSLTSVTIPNSVTSIGNWAFAHTSLTSVTIGNGVTSIGESAFASCTSLTSVYCKATTPPTGGWDMFYNNDSGRKIYVPRNSVEAYKSAEYWSDYASDIEGYDF